MKCSLSDLCSWVEVTFCPEFAAWEYFESLHRSENIETLWLSYTWLWLIKKKKQYFTLSLFPLLVVCKMPSKAQGRSNFPSLVLGFNWTVMARGTLLNKVGHSKCMPDTGEINREKITEERGKEGNGGGRYMVVTPTIWFSLFYTRVLKSETCLYVQILGCLFLHSVGLRNSCWT